MPARRPIGRRGAMVAEAYRAGLLVAHRALLALRRSGRGVQVGGRLLDRAVVGLGHGVGVGVVELQRFAPDCGVAGFGHVVLLVELTVVAHITRQ